MYAEKVLRGWDWSCLKKIYQVWTSFSSLLSKDESWSLSRSYRISQRGSLVITEFLNSEYQERSLAKSDKVLNFKWLLFRCFYMELGRRKRLLEYRCWKLTWINRGRSSWHFHLWVSRDLWTWYHECCDLGT